MPAWRSHIVVQLPDFNDIVRSICNFVIFDEIIITTGWYKQAYQRLRLYAS